MAKPPHPLPEGLDIMLCGRWSARKKVPDPRDLLWLLRLGWKAKRKEHRA